MLFLLTKIVETIKATKPDVIVIYKDVILPNPPALVDMKDICADRAKFLALKPKKKKLKRDLRFHELSVEKFSLNPKQKFSYYFAVYS